MDPLLRSFLVLPYAELQARNLALKHARESGESEESFAERLRKEIGNDAGVKAVTLCFSDLEGKLHMLDYDKHFFLAAEDNLTFDGSSIRGFTSQNQSDLRLRAEWRTFRWLPADVFGSGKVLMFANVHDKDGSPYAGDFRSNLKIFSETLKAQESIDVFVAPEIEGFLLEDTNAEQKFSEDVGFQLATCGGYYNALPKDKLRMFIDVVAEVTRAMGFENEKDHPEVAPAQFEINYKYTNILYAADQVQLYKLVAREIAKSMGYTASFLPKPVVGINGSGMHTNMSLAKSGKNMFFAQQGNNRLSPEADRFVTGVLFHANELCLAISSSVNSYRRLDPKFEAPNEIKTSPVDRGSMVRIPIGNERSARIEVRSVAPDANPYLAWYLILRAGLDGMQSNDYATMQAAVNVTPVRKLHGNIQDAIAAFGASGFMKQVMGAENHVKFVELKQGTADRSPKDLGTRIKNGEVLYHHEITNQSLWTKF